jgi:energy-coupling factor transport system permease protein
VAKLSCAPVKLLLKGLKNIMFILLFTVTLNIFFTPGENYIFEFHFIRISSQGLIMAGRLALRLMLLIVSSALLTLTTTPLSLTGAIEFYLTPFAKIGLPAQEISMMMSIALRFIPVLMEETDKIMKAQKARGADFETGGLVKRARALIPILIPLFVSAFRRAEDLAMAMEARCYQTDLKRTKMRPLKCGRSDYAAVCGVVVFAAGIAGLRFVGFSR